MPVFEEINGIQYGSGIKAVLYGQEGVGKSSLAANIPGIVFIDCEGSTTKMNVRRLPAPTSWAMLCDEMDFIRENAAAKGYRAVAIDTFDWAESLALQAVCTEHNINGIEGLNYGKGWQYESELIARFLGNTDKLIKAGVHVILICHAISRKTTLPEEIDEYDHWELKLGNKTTNKIAPLLKEWSDMTPFLAFKTQIMAADDKGKVHKATSVQRVMYATKSAWWDAKNRFGLPAMMPLDYGAIAHLFAPPAETMLQHAQEAGIPLVTTNVPEAPPQPASSAELPGDLSEYESLDSLCTDWTGIPDALTALMKANGVLPAHIEKISSEVFRYFPAGMPVRDYPQDYHEWLCANWMQVIDAVNQNCPDYVPF